jgi:AraC-like DNA-binding protein
MVDRLEGPLALTIERGPSLPPLRRQDPRAAILLALGSSVVERAIGDDVERLDRSNVVVVPGGVAYRLTAVSPTTELLTLLLGDEARARAQREYRPHVDARVYADVLARPLTLPRTRWFDEIAQRYLFERAVCEKHASQAARFLETEIAKEIYFLGKECLAERTRDSVVRQAGSVAEQGRRYIEERLFEPLRVAAVARACRASESTLLRAFREELGVTPAAYQRQRRLDEALLLLESGSFTASEVAAKVGYADLPAFTVAFQRRFDASPSEVRARGREGRRGRLPPHGEPPIPPKPVTERHKTLTGARKARRKGRAKRSG